MTYLSVIEREFLAARGVGVSLSGADIELARSWESSGVPIAVVVRALQRGGRSGRPMRSLRSVSYLVDEELALHRRAHPDGSSRPAPSRATRIDAMRDKLAAETPLTEPVDRRVVAALDAGRATLDDAPVDALPHRVWSGVLDAVFDALYGSLDRLEAAQFQRDNRAPQGMSKTASAAHQAKDGRRWLAQRFGLTGLLGRVPQPPMSATENV